VTEARKKARLRQAAIGAAEARRIAAQEEQLDARPPFDPMPDGYHEIAIKALTNGTEVVILEQAGVFLPDEPGEGEPEHNCDALGCAFEHVVARFLIRAE
jgi:hypothetical protein